ncbi:unconventional prefoldin RPB5 interactor isoform X2 [Carex littledalei]|uniref:Unconventional prefoldin RPB5 interactor isoform X2 n=1 Tax=Carex littledalei TaxID=544730 RepID=A0A833RE84_9POAL|nr:unconventional prefoldin RPB5 interactor isoform X2 [Carex littledalei]
MAASEVKGKAIALDSVYSPEETAKAVHRVEEVVAERRRELDGLRRFAAENSSLSSLVQRLPDETFHDIMVPFGGVAFFPGRLIHTNELLVLLGEGYYAERSAKQTAEILQRRGKSLEDQIDFLKATIADLEAEAKFFSSTATEAAEGLVEIREEYIEHSQDNISGSSSSKRDEDIEREKDEEYKRVMARLNELEMEEQEAGSDGEEDADEVEQPGISEMEEESDEEEEMTSTNEFRTHRADISFSEPKEATAIGKMISQPKVPAAKVVTFSIPEEQPVSTSESIIPSQIQHYATLKPTDNPEESKTSHKSMMGSSTRRAFTGSIVEHDHGLAPIHPQISTPADQPPSSNPSRPVSRFKLQKGSR